MDDYIDNYTNNNYYNRPNRHVYGFTVYCISFVNNNFYKSVYTINYSYYVTFLFGHVYNG